MIVVSMRKRDLGILLLAALAIFFSLQVSGVVASCEILFRDSVSEFAIMNSCRFKFGLEKGGRGNMFTKGSGLFRTSKQRCN